MIHILTSIYLIGALIALLVSYEVAAALPLELDGNRSTSHKSLTLIEWGGVLVCAILWPIMLIGAIVCEFDESEDWDE